MFIPIRWKILGAFLPLLVGLLAASLFLVHRHDSRQLEESLQRELEITRDTFFSLLESREKQIASALALVGGDFAFKKAVFTHDPETIASAAMNFQQRLKADVFFVTDETGLLLAATDPAAKPGADLSPLPVVARALEGESQATVLMLEGRTFQLAAAPLLAPDPIGVLVAGFRIDDAVARDLKRLTRSDVSFASSAALVASTLGEADRAELQAESPRLAPGKTRLLGPRGRRQIVLPAEPSPHVRVYIQRPWDDALEPLRRLQQVLLLIGLSGTALALAAGVLLSSQMTASTRRLAKATGRLAEGDFSVRVELSSKDEMGQLGKTFNQMVEGLQEKEKIRSVLNKTVSKEIAEELLRRGQINLGGEEREVTVLFSDVRGFTSISEKLTPQELVGRLNGYFSQMADAIERHGGVIDKFIGDAIMALFGAPLQSPGDAPNALRAALAMAEALERLNAGDRLKDLTPWRNGIGLNTGPAVAGTMGSESRWSYTVIGDAVNLASRLEGLTKHFGAQILVSGRTREAGGAGFLYRSVDLVAVKGKETAVPVFELLAENTSGPAWLTWHEEAVSLYREGAWDPSRNLFRQVLKEKPEDVLSGDYLSRMEGRGAQPPAGWSPARTMSEK